MARIKKGFVSSGDDSKKPISILAGVTKSASGSPDSQSGSPSPHQQQQQPKQQQEKQQQKDPSASFAIQMIVLSMLISAVAHAWYVSTTAAAASQADNSSSTALATDLPPQSVFIDPRSFNVLSTQTLIPFRNNSFDAGTAFNPTGTAPPFFQIFDRRFLALLGPHPAFNEVASNASYAFAHEAPVYNPPTDEVFFASNNGGPLGQSGLDKNSKVFKMNMGAVEDALTAVGAFGPGGRGKSVNVPYTDLNLSDAIQMTNGGTGPYHSDLLLITSGRGTRAPAIARVNPAPPHNVTVLLDNYYGRQFTSLNDIKVHPSGKIFFTDVTYGALWGFRPAPRLPNQVYVFDPDTGAVRVAAADFDKPNGLAFTQDGRTAYVADTGAASIPASDQTKPATIYAYTIDPTSSAFLQRRTFAYADAGIPDGLQVDTQGNVYAGCGDGVHVWAADGTLLGKFFIGRTSANMVFAKPGRLVILGETKVYVAHIDASVDGVASPFP